ncbi:MAG: MoaD/ThiS family protein [Spirochaetales bacterium]|nr:MAG: MoaD/ThiS family protein [Spirochaetales bacterium]
MPRITVKYLVNIRDKTGTGNEDLELPENASLQDAADKIRELHGLSLPDARIMATLNGVGWAQCVGGMKTPLKEKDVILLFPPLSGG